MTDVFVEIGPGRGALTRPLATHAKYLTAFEIDRDLAADLRADALPNVTVVETDVLEISASDLPTADALRVAGNLPYNVASPIMFKLAEWITGGAAIVDATLMLQREVADRLTAVPSTKDYGVLTILVGHTASVKRLLALPPGAFRPAPKVSSALVRLQFHPPDPPVRDQAAFAMLVQAVFTRRRKTLGNALAALGKSPQETSQALNRAEIDGRRRPETLTIAEFAHLANLLAT